MIKTINLNGLCTFEYRISLYVYSVWAVCYMFTLNKITYQQFTSHSHMFIWVVYNTLVLKFNEILKCFSNDSKKDLEKFAKYKKRIFKKVNFFLTKFLLNSNKHYEKWLKYILYIYETKVLKTFFRKKKNI